MIVLKSVPHQCSVDCACPYTSKCHRRRKATAPSSRAAYIHAVVQDADGGCCCLQYKLVASDVLQLGESGYTSFIQPSANFSLVDKVKPVAVLQDRARGSLAQ